jgi:hypothetical protein
VFTEGDGPAGEGSVVHSPDAKTADPFVVPTRISPAGPSESDRIEEPGSPVAASNVSKRCPSYRPSPPVRVPTQRNPARSWQTAVTWSCGSPSRAV